MKLSFDIGIEDVMAFHSNHYDIKFADKIARQLMWILWSIPILFVIIGTVLFFVHSQDWNFLKWFGLLALASVFALSMRRSRDSNKTNWLKKVRKTVDIPENAIWFGKHTMEFYDERVVVASDFSNETISWSAFVRVSETLDHFFLYISNIQALLVPKRAMTGIQVDDLTQLLSNKIKK